MLLWASSALADPVNTSPPQVTSDTAGASGTLAVDPGPTLSVSNGSWSSSGADDMTYALQWQSCAYPNAVLADAPVAYYRLGEPAGSSAAVDVSGFGQPSVGAAASQAGATGAIVGDGDTACQFPLRMPIRGILYARTFGDSFTPSDFPRGTSPASIEAWVNPAGTPAGDGFIAGFGSDAVDGASLNLEVVNTGSTVRLAAYDGVRQYVATSGSIVPGTWYHVALTYAGSTIRLYQDGVLVGAFAEASTFSLVPDAARIDASVPAQTVLQSFGGSIDDVAFYPSALDTATVAAHHTAGVDASSAERCNDIPAATGLTLAVTPDLAGTRVRAQVEASDGTASTAAWSNEVALGGSVVVPQSQDLTGTIPFGPTLINGSVVDSAGVPVAGARVSVYANLETRTRVTEPLLAEALTGSDGSYSISFAAGATPLLNLIVVARGQGVGTTSFVTRQYDDEAGLWLDDSGALPLPLQSILPATGASTLLSGPSRYFPAPCPPPTKHLIKGPTPGIMNIGDVHTWSYEKAQLVYVQGSKSTVSIAASLNPNNGFVSTDDTATISGGYSVTQRYPMRGPNTSIAETTAANAAEYKIWEDCWDHYYTVEPYSFIGGTTNPRAVSVGKSGHCPTSITNNSTYGIPGSAVARSSGRGYTYGGGFTVSLPGLSIGLSVRTDWSSNTTETLYPQSGYSNKLWICGDGSNVYWYKAQRIYSGPWTS